jgi:hypothetical protein
MVRKKKAAPRPVIDQITNMDEVLLQCRDMRHAWVTETPYYKIDIEGGIKGALYVERIIACMRCNTKRIEFYRVFKDRLERISSHYSYSEGYQIKGVKKGDHVQDKVRRELYSRTVEKFTVT